MPPVVTVPTPWLTGSISVPASESAWLSCSVYMMGAFLYVVGREGCGRIEAAPRTATLVSRRRFSTALSLFSHQNHKRTDLRHAVLQRDRLIQPGLTVDPFHDAPRHLVA